MYTYIYIYIYIYIHTYMHIYSYIHTYIHTCIYRTCCYTMPSARIPHLSLRLNRYVLIPVAAGRAEQGWVYGLGLGFRV